MSTSTLKLSDMGILSILSAVFSGQIEEGAGSKIKFDEKRDTVRGTLTNPASRRLVTALERLDDEIEQACVEHDKSHHDCDSFGKFYNASLEKQKRLLDLLALAAVAEMPAAVSNLVDLRDGWTVVSTGHWKEIGTLQGNNPFAQDFVKNLEGAITRTEPWTDQAELHPAADGETVIAELQDHRVRALFGLCVKAARAFDENIPKDFRDKNLQFIGKMTINDVRCLAITKVYYTQTCDILGDLFWDALEEVVPATVDLDEVVGIRQDWKVVKSRLNKEGLDNPLFASLVINLTRRS